MLKKLGFTMIELLIVIAVLGILAVAVLASINPIEQINRGRDTGSRSDAEQLISAIDRFYAAKGYYPWMNNGVSTNTWTDPAATGISSEVLFPLDTVTPLVGNDGIPVGTGIDILSLLSSGGSAELKASFTSRIVNPSAPNYLSIYNSGVSGESTYVCFLPKSASFREEAWDRCTDLSGTYALSANLPVDYPTTTACLAGPTCATAQTADAATDCQICLP